MFQNKSWLEIIGLFLVFVGLTIFFNILSSGFPNNSDNATEVIEAEDFLSGNWLLHGWTLPPDSFTTTEMPLYIIGILVQGFSPNLMHDIPAVVYALLVIVSAYVASQGFESRSKWIARTSVVIGLLLVGEWNMSFLLKGTYHAVTLLMITSSLLLINRKGLGEIMAYVTMVAGIVGDPLALFIGPFPIVLSIAYHKIRKTSVGNTIQSKFFVKIIMVILSGVAIHFLVPVLGGYNYDQWLITLPTWSEFIRNILLLIRGIPAVYGAYFVGHPLDLVGIGYFVRLIPLIFLGYVIWQWVTKRYSFSFFDSVLVLAMPIVACGFVLFPVAHFAPEVRYLSPILIYGIIVIGQYLAKTSWTKSSIIIKGTIVALIMVTWIPSLEFNPVVDNDYIILGNWLILHHLYSGYAGYWDSNIVTMLSNEKVSIAPVVSGGPNGTLSRFPHLSNIAWYENPQQNPRTFLVYDDSDWGSVNKNTAIKTWGEPVSIEKVTKFTILIWDHPIIPNPIAYHKF